MTAQGILVQDSRFGRNPVKWGRRQGFTTLAASLFQALTRVWRYTKSASPGCRAAAFRVPCDEYVFVHRMLLDMLLHQRSRLHVLTGKKSGDLLQVCRNPIPIVPADVRAAEIGKTVFGVAVAEHAASKRDDEIADTVFANQGDTTRRRAFQAGLGSVVRRFGRFGEREIQPQLWRLASFKTVRAGGGADRNPPHAPRRHKKGAWNKAAAGGAGQRHVSATPA